MKKLLLMWAVLLCAAVQAQDAKLIASCCDTKSTTEVGRCSADAYCTACTNCRYCKHCSKEGGSCGVCTTYEAPKKTKAVKTTRVAKQPDRYRKNQMIETTQNVNLRKGAGTDYHVIRKIDEGSMLTFISYEGEWIYVRVDGTDLNGWVNYKYVK